MKRNIFLLLCVIGVFAACKNDTEESENSNGKKVKQITPEVTALQQRVQLHPDSVGLRLKLAMELDSLNMYQPAITQMDLLLQNDSTNYGLWYTRGLIYEHATDTAKAIQDYAKAINIYPSPDALLSLANLYAEQKNARSLLICNQVRKMGLGRSYDAAAAFIAGVYNARTGQQQLALNLFDDCISNDYTYMEAYIEKGLLYFDRKQYRQALDVFSLAATVNHLYPDAYYYMARCYEMMQMKDSAKFYFQQSLALDKNSPETKAALERVEK